MLVGGGRFTPGGSGLRSDSGRGDGSSGLQFGGEKTCPRSKQSPNYRNGAECLLVDEEMRFPVWGGSRNRAPEEKPRHQKKIIDEFLIRRHGGSIINNPNGGGTAGTDRLLSLLDGDNGA
ncbi:hypothetical protein JTB14_023016 [Gonioctena quinquepunctata]|nr:hypothetical protein JTB14_023016 [Gonioctena quinquepunctata]